MQEKECSSLDWDEIIEIVRKTQGVTLEEASAARIAAAHMAVRRTLAAVAEGSVFDTEPAGFPVALQALARTAEDER